MYSKVDDLAILVQLNARDANTLTKNHIEIGVSHNIHPFVLCRCEFFVG